MHIIRKNLEGLQLTTEEGQEQGRDEEGYGAVVRAGQVMTTEQSVGEAFRFHTLDLMRSRMLKWKHLRED